MSENRLYVTDTRVSNLRESISSVLANLNKITARHLAEVTGRIISMHKAIGSAVYLYTRQMYLAIETRASWDCFISCSPRMISELQFWHNNVSQMNGRDLFHKTQVFDSVVYSDASQIGYGGARGSGQLMIRERVPPGESSELFIICYRPFDTSSQDTKYSVALTIRM